MPKFLEQKDAFLRCKKEGKFIITEDVDTDRIRSLLKIAEADVNSANLIIKNLDSKEILWSSIYKLYYDSLHELTEAFLRFEKVKIENHQCLFAYLCEIHPELEFSWDFFEIVRTKRNGINYYGTPITHNDWKSAEIQFKLYINKLKEEISKKLLGK